MRARLRDTELYFDIDGASLIPDGARMRERPTAFLIHGGPGSDHSSLKLRYGRLAQKVQVVYFDHRGQGRSARGNSAKYTLDENVADLEALREHLGLNKIVSIGTSYGGMVAMAHAARYPSAVSHLVLVVTAAHAGFTERARAIVRQSGTAEQIALCEDLFAGRVDTEEKMRRYFAGMASLYSRKESLAPSSPSSPSSTASPALDGAILSPPALNRALAPNGFLRTFDLRQELGSITAPTLICAGRHDWICPPEFSEEIHQLIPGSDLRIFEESSHYIGVDEPDQFLDAVVGFLVYSPSRSSSDGLAQQH